MSVFCHDARPWLISFSLGPGMPGSQSMSQESIYSTLYAALTLTDSIFQIWITLTFAVVVATYVAGQRFDRPVYLLVSTLYALASAVLSPGSLAPRFRRFTTNVYWLHASLNHGRLQTLFRS